MARTYKPATFQPTVRPDWGGALSYLPESEKAEILEAIIKYPSKECNSVFWTETIKPDLDLQHKVFKDACERKKQAIRDRWGKISTTYLQHMNKISTTAVKDMNEICNTYVVDTEDKDKDKDKEKDKDDKKGGVGEKGTKVLNNQTPFSIGGDDWKFSPECLKLVKKQWSNSVIRQIESDYSHRPPTEITIEKLLDEYPSDKVPFKILGEKKSIPLTQKQWEWFAKQGIAPAVKVKAIDLLEEYAVSNPKRFKQYSDLSIIIGRGWAYREAFKEPYKFENQEHMVAELQRVGLR